MPSEIVQDLLHKADYNQPLVKIASSLYKMPYDKTTSTGTESDTAAVRLLNCAQDSMREQLHEGQANNSEPEALIRFIDESAHGNWSDTTRRALKHMFALLSSDYYARSTGIENKLNDAVAEINGQLFRERMRSF